MAAQKTPEASVCASWQTASGWGRSFSGAVKDNADFLQGDEAAIDHFGSTCNSHKPSLPILRKPQKLLPILRTRLRIDSLVPQGSPGWSDGEFSLGKKPTTSTTPTLRNGS